MSTWFVVAATVVEAAAVVIAVVYAKGQLGELRESREDTTRPFVVVDLDSRHTIAFIRVTNFGQSIARNVNFTFTPALESTFDDRKGNGEYRLAKIDIFANGIPSLAPRRELSTILDQVPPRIQAGLPNSYEVDVSYEGPKGTQYTDRQTISLDTHLTLTRIERKDVHDVARYLEEISREIKKWGAMGGGLRAVNDEEYTARFADHSRRQATPDEPDEDAGDDDPDEQAA
jgi:hypothetical protein